MWKNFDWDLFLTDAERQRLPHPVHGVALIYSRLRAASGVRWKIFLRPIRPRGVSDRTGRAHSHRIYRARALGRPGELIRPYLIAGASCPLFSSQIAVWAVERIFDVAGFTPSLCWRPSCHGAEAVMSSRGVFEEIAVVLIVIVVGLTFGALAVHRSGEALAAAGWNGASRIALPILASASRISNLREFRSGLNTTHDKKSPLMLIGVSVLDVGDDRGRLHGSRSTRTTDSQAGNPADTDFFADGVEHGGLCWFSFQERRRRLSQFATIETLNHIFVAFLPELATKGAHRAAVAGDRLSPSRRSGCCQPIASGFRCGSFRRRVMRRNSRARIILPLERAHLPKSF